MKNKKPVAILLIALIFVSLSCGVVGLIQKTKGETKAPEEKQYNVLYKYYLDDVEVTEMPRNVVSLSSSMASSTINDVEKKYAFNTASCTNKVTYKWDEAKWEFIPSNTADSTCKLYFVSTYNELTVEATNATVTPLEDNKIKRGENAVIIIKPTEGYVYDKTTCTNNEVVEWNEEKTELTVKSIYKTTSCKSEFKISKYNVEIIVNNGTGSTKLIDKDYGSKIEANVAASTGYNNPTISCTNNQVGTWTNGVFTIDKLTKETACTISFVAIPTTTNYTVTMNVGNHGRLATGSTVQTVASGASASFSFASDEGWLLDDPTCTGGTAERNGNIITIKDVKSNVECTANYKANNQ